jgi:hypothetical protein
MRVQSAAWNSAAVNVALVLACAAVGMVGLPLAFSGSISVTWLIWLWLVGGVVVSVGILLLIAALATSATLAVGPLLPRADSNLTPSQARLVVRLLLFGLALIAVQASLRRPLALLIGGPGSASSIEATVAAAALAVVLGALVWSYESARPIVQGLTWRAIDAAIPTVTAPLAAEPTRTMSVVNVGPIPSATDAPTLRATPSDGDADVTLRAAQADPGATVLIPRPDVDPTLRVSPSDPDATIRRGDDRK